MIVSPLFKVLSLQLLKLKICTIVLWAIFHTRNTISILLLNCWCFKDYFPYIFFAHNSSNVMIGGDINTDFNRCTDNTKKLSAEAINPTSMFCSSPCFSHCASGHVINNTLPSETHTSMYFFIHCGIIITRCTRGIRVVFSRARLQSSNRARMYKSNFTTEKIV